MSERVFILAFIDWNAIFAVGLGVVLVGSHILGLGLKQMKKSSEAEQRRLGRPLDSGEAGRVQARTDAAATERVERPRVLNGPPMLGAGQTQRGRIEAALKARVAAEMKRRAEIEQTIRAQRAARQSVQARQPQPQQQRSTRPASPASSPPAPKPVPVAPQQTAQRRQPPAPSAPQRLVKQAGSSPLTPVGGTPARAVKAPTGRTLRQAFIWHEILDRPVALREPIEPV